MPVFVGQHYSIYFDVVTNFTNETVITHSTTLLNNYYFDFQVICNATIVQIPSAPTPAPTSPTYTPTPTSSASTLLPKFLSGILICIIGKLL